MISDNTIHCGPVVLGAFGDSVITCDPMDNAKNQKWVFIQLEESGVLKDQLAGSPFFPLLFSFLFSSLLFSSLLFSSLLVSSRLFSSLLFSSLPFSSPHFIHQASDASSRRQEIIALLNSLSNSDPDVPLTYAFLL
jgi:hypothetical protein